MEINIILNSETEKNESLQVTLDGPELSTAITDYIAKRGITCHTPPDHVWANYEACENATVNLAPEDIVELSPAIQEQLGVKDPSKTPTACLVADWIRNI